ncbi:MAG TPA: hypothetical protein VG870_01665 [Chitinophagaceae bacterium]|nr:hypothetical protein [Chitinophagaceae bacterium]
MKPFLYTCKPSVRVRWQSVLLLDLGVLVACVIYLLVMVAWIRRDTGVAMNPNQPVPGQANTIPSAWRIGTDHAPYQARDRVNNLAAGYRQAACWNRQDAGGPRFRIKTNS